jgi:DNA-binding MarR family transcriptional regulator/predicted N-acetyltransferase YhbS
MDSTPVAQVRRFNRTVTQRVGALNDTYLSRGRPLGQARLLWEIGAGGEEIRAVRSRLDLDSGYLSRLLRALERDGLITIGVPEADGRTRMIHLTDAGRAERAELDRLSDQLADSILRPLTDRQRDRLTGAMAEVERLLRASMVEIAPVDPRAPAVQQCLRFYAAELAERFDGGFEPGNSPVLPEKLEPPHGLQLLATLHGDPVACACFMLKPEPGPPGTTWALIKRMWVSPSVRGLGLGRRMLGELERHAIAHGADTIRLDTNKVLTEALALYRSAGYAEVEPFSDEFYAHHWFEKPLRDKEN